MKTTRYTKRVPAIIVLLIITFLLSSCIEVYLTKNVTKIPDSMEGSWLAPQDSKTEHYMIKKKDDYWAYLISSEDDTKRDLRLHKFDNKIFVCISKYKSEKGEREGIVYSIKQPDKNTINFYPMDFTDKADNNTFKDTATEDREELFIKYLKNGKISILEKEPWVWERDK